MATPSIPNPSQPPIETIQSEKVNCDSPSSPTTRQRKRSRVDNQLEELLEFPRWLMRARLPLVQDCHRATVFDIGSATCRRCGHRPECEWLHAYGEPGPGPARPRIDALVAIEAAIIDAEQMVSLTHIKSVCCCRVCRWLRKAWEVTRRERERERPRKGSPAKASPRTCQWRWDPYLDRVTAREK